MGRTERVKKDPGEVNYLRSLFRGYMRARGITSKELAGLLNCSPGNVRVWLNKPAKEWKIGAIIEYCDALSIPYTEAFTAACKK
nr:helix-turn-helix domain-containing protein [Clostridia bacterium]